MATPDSSIEVVDPDEEDGTQGGGDESDLSGLAGGGEEVDEEEPSLAELIAAGEAAGVDLSPLARVGDEFTLQQGKRQQAFEAEDQLALLFDIATSLGVIRRTATDDPSRAEPRRMVFQVGVDAGDDILTDPIRVRRPGNTLRATVVLDSSAVFQLRNIPDADDKDAFTSKYNNGAQIDAAEEHEFSSQLDDSQKVNYRVDTDSVTVRKLFVTEFETA